MGVAVEKVERSQAVPYLLHRHYARCVPSIVYSFGLFVDGALCGVCVFGTSANPKNNEIGGYKAIELVRFFIEDEISIKNAASYFLSRCLCMIPKNTMVVSYADPHSGHNGYIYQATNWYYVGQGQRKDGKYDYGVIGFVDNSSGKKMHARTFGGKFGVCDGANAKAHGFTRTFTKPKHKYLYFTGKNKNAAYEATGLNRVPYPKGENIRYDTGAFPGITESLPIFGDKP